MSKAIDQNKDDIINRSTDEGDCMNIMKSEIDKEIQNYVDSNKFFQEVPKKITDDLKKQKESEFHDSFVTN